jgi:hypothetical protein
VLPKNGRIRKIENLKNPVNARRAIKNRDLRLQGKTRAPLLIVVSTAKNDAQSDQEETSLHKKAPL